MPTSVENLKHLRELFPQKSLEYLKTVATFCKNDAASLVKFIRDAVETDDFPPFPVKPDDDLEEFLRLQLATLKEMLPDAEDEYLENLFKQNAGSPNMETAALEAVISQTYPKKSLPEKTKFDFDIKLYCEQVPDPLMSFSHANYIMTKNMEAEAVDYLVKVFGKDKKAAISGHVNKMRCLYLAFQTLQKEGGEAEGQLSREAIKTVQPKTFDELPDYSQVFEKLLIENEGVILSYLEERKADEKKLYELEESQQSLQECAVCCYATVSIKMIKICDDGHIMCASCVQHHTELLYHQGILFFPCAFNCKLFISSTVVRSAWDSSRYSKLLEDRISAKTKDLMPCPFCRYLNEDPKVQEILCTHCCKKFCVFCKKIAHLPMECNKKENDLCRQVEEVMTEELVRKCPMCMNRYIKEAGYCNRMYCEKCRIWSCYLCGKITSGNNYGHFYGQGVMPSEAPGRCPLFSDINHLHVYNVVNAGRKAFEKLKKENPNVQLLYNPLDRAPLPGKSDAVPNQF